MKIHARRAHGVGYSQVIIIAWYMCRYDILYYDVTVTSMASCDVISIAYKCSEPRTIVTCIY